MRAIVRLEFRLHGLADVHAVRAAQVEGAARGLGDGAGHFAAQHRAARGLVDVRQRHRREQRLRVGVQRVSGQVARVRQFDDLAKVHHGDAVAHVFDHGKIVGDEDIGQVQLLLDVLHQVEYLRLNGHIQRRDRLIADEQVGADAQRAGNAQALALAAGKLVRKAHQVVRLDVDQLEGGLDHRLPFLGALVAVYLERLGEGIVDALDRVERGIGVLKDHLHALAELEQFLTVEAHDVLELAVKIVEYLAAGGVLQTHDGLAQRGLAAAGFPHHAQRLALIDGEAEVIHGLDVADVALEHPLAQRIPCAQVLDVENSRPVLLTQLTHINAPPGGP